MKHTIFTGAATALVTPFTEEGIDWDAFGRLIDFQLEQGIDALVVAGTTGEGSTVTDREHEDMTAFCVKRVAGKVPVIAGTGSNNTAHAIERTKTACKAGADAVGPGRELCRCRGREQRALHPVQRAFPDRSEHAAPDPGGTGEA